MKSLQTIPRGYQGMVQRYATTPKVNFNLGYREAFRALKETNAESQENLVKSPTRPHMAQVKEGHRKEIKTKSSYGSFDNIAKSVLRRDELQRQVLNRLMREKLVPCVNFLHVETSINKTHQQKNVISNVLKQWVELKLKTKQKVTSREALQYFKHLEAFPNVEIANQLLKNLTRHHEVVKKSWVVKTMHITMKCKDIKNSCQIFDRLPVDLSTLDQLDAMIVFLIQHNEIASAKVYHEKFNAFHDSKWIHMFRHFFKVCQSEADFDQVLKSLQKYTKITSYDLCREIYPIAEKLNCKSEIAQEMNKRYLKMMN